MARKKCWQAGESRQQLRVFTHEPTKTVLLFRDVGEQPVSPADAMSTEMRLQSNGISDETLESLSQSFEPMQR
jgi:hypothetical protein